MTSSMGMAGKYLFIEAAWDHTCMAQWYLDRDGISRIGIARRARELESLPSLSHVFGLILLPGN